MCTTLIGKMKMEHRENDTYRVDHTIYVTLPSYRKM